MGPSADHATGIMIAPNGARLTQADHPAIPINAAELANAVADAVEQGAQAVHLHVRDSQQLHVLDASLYLDAISVLGRSLGKNFPIQITTEAVGRYFPAEQIKLVQDVRPEFVSVALSELAGEDSQLSEASRFYHWCQAEHVSVQHILYSASDFRRFLQLKEQEVIPADNEAVLFVLGRYTPGQVSEPAMLDEFLQVKRERGDLDCLQWMICAFGRGETSCLAYAASCGGHLRTGFENNRINEDGTIAASNAERVQAVARRIDALPSVRCGSDRIRQVLGQRD